MVDFISQLSDNMLLLILSGLPTKEAIRTSTLSKRWKRVWKNMTHLELYTPRRDNERRFYNMQRTTVHNMLRLPNNSNPDAALTRIINNHRAYLQSCVISYFSDQGEHGLINSWIRSLIRVSRTRNLTVIHSKMHQILSDPCSFNPSCRLRYPTLTSLSLKAFEFTSSVHFDNCSNIKTLKLTRCACREGRIINKILVSCPSVEVLILDDFRCRQNFTLKIENSKLKFLEISSVLSPDKVIVSAASLDMLVARDLYYQGDRFLLRSPNLQFNQNSSVGQTIYLRIIYNISKEKHNGHQEFVKRSGELLSTVEEKPILSVAVDIMNQTEVERLREFLCLSSRKIKRLEIKFKENKDRRPSEEIEGWQKKLWVMNDNPPFPFTVSSVWIYNFSGSKEEMAWVSCLIRHKRVLQKIMIKSRLNINTKLEELRTRHESLLEDVTIESF